MEFSAGNNLHCGWKPIFKWLESKSDNFACLSEEDKVVHSQIGIVEYRHHRVMQSQFHTVCRYNILPIGTRKYFSF